MIDPCVSTLRSVKTHATGIMYSAWAVAKPAQLVDKHVLLTCFVLVLFAGSPPVVE